jgi:acyl-CoA thioesterase
MLTLTQFDRTTTVTAEPSPVPGEGALRFTADLDGTWASLRGMHGGYMTALAVRVAESVVPERAVRTISTTFLRPAAPGPAELVAEVIRSGRSLTTMVVTLSQEGRAITNTRITSLATVDGHDWSRPVAVRPVAREHAVPFTPPPSIPHFQQAQLLIDPNSIPLADSEHALIAGYVRPIEARILDAPWLAMIGDWFPPSPFRRYEPPIGGVSLDYTIHVHRTVELGADDWITGVFEAADSHDGIALERGWLSDADGSAIAETFHTRWTG